MTKRMFLTSFAVLALVATASMVLAQQGGQGRQAGQGRQGGQGPQAGQNFQGGLQAGILGIADARTALGVTDDQWQKYQDATRAIREANPAPARTGGGAPATPDPAAQAAARERTQKIAAETRKNLESILSKEQVEKYDAMVFQRTGGLNPPAPAAGGPGAGGGAGFAGGAGNAITVDSLRALNLTDDQKKKVQEAIDKRAEATRALGPAAGGPNAPQQTQEERTARREATQKISGEFFAAVKAALTDAQKAKAEELMKDVPEFLRPQRPAGAGANAPGSGAGNRGGNAPGGGAGACNRGAGGGGNRGNRAGGNN